MSTITSSNPTKMFISTTKELMNDLIEAFPDMKTKIKSKLLMLESVEKSSGKILVGKYIKYVFPHLEKVIKKDDTLLTTDVCPPILKDLDISVWWPLATNDVKDTVWKYIHLLCLLSCKIHPQDANVENIIQTVWSNNYC